MSTPKRGERLVPFWLVVGLIVSFLFLCWVADWLRLQALRVLGRQLPQS